MAPIHLTAIGAGSTAKLSLLPIAYCLLPGKMIFFHVEHVFRKASIIA